MNWLAHLLLSEPTPEFRLGNVLPDILSITELRRLPAAYLRGAECHWRIDRFTDAHPAMRRSIARLAPAHRRFGGIIMDVFYDHLLATEWNSHCEQPLEEFTQSVYADIEARWTELPPTATERLRHMRSDDWLCSYREVTGIRTALNRIGSRLRQPQPLGDSVADLENQHELLRADFHEFFPELRAHIQPAIAAKG